MRTSNKAGKIQGGDKVANREQLNCTERAGPRSSRTRRRNDWSAAKLTFGEMAAEIRCAHPRTGNDLVRETARVFSRSRDGHM